MRTTTVALVMVNAMLAMATPMVTPLAKRKLVTEYKTKCVTDYVYPDGSPAHGHGHGHHAKPTEKPQVYYHDEEEHDSDPEPHDYKPQKTDDRDGGHGGHGGHGGGDSKPQGGGSSGNYADPGDDFVQNCLVSHNVHRHNHSAPDVAWSEALASAAQELANSCSYGHNTDLGSYSGGYGQNIAMYAATNNLGSEVEFIRTSINEYWYAGEIELYGNAYGSEPSMSNFHDWGHFTQIVWKGTKEVGCAVAYCESGLASYPGYYSVCNYGPPGNYDGEYADNVGAPLGDSTVGSSGPASGNAGSY